MFWHAAADYTVLESTGFEELLYIYMCDIGGGVGEGELYSVTVMLNVRFSFGDAP